MNNIRNYGFITITFLLLLTLSCASSSEATEESATAQKNVNVPETLKKADDLFQQREDLAKLREAVKTLSAARHSDNRNFEVEWTYSKYNYFLGKQAESDKEIDAAFKEGEKAAQIASRIAPNKPEGYFWFAANLGEAAKRSPMTVGLKRVDEIREAMRKVIEIQPDYQGASAYDGLARIELETGIIGGKTEKAIEYLEKGLELEKNNSNLRLNLAKAYLRVDRNPEAKKQLEYVVKMEPDAEYKVEYQENLKEAKRLLESRF
jgi:tetratricopeptide (TPR) repeat protein